MVQFALIDNNVAALTENSPRKIAFRNAFDNIPGESWECIHFKQLAHPEIFQKVLGMDGLILSGANISLVNKYNEIDKDSVELVKDVIRLIKEFKNPILGICFAHQLIAFTEGATIRNIPPPNYEGEAGKIITIDVDSEFDLIKGTIDVEVIHHKEVINNIALNENFTVYARSEICEVQVIKHKTRPLYGIQFHPETLMDEKAKIFGVQLLQTFIKML
jgi:GMP synthase-like glutamine amidotransferase